MEQRPTSQVLCRYHMNGACKKGSNCLFSHNMADLPNITCQYWLQGVCAYGERCRYLHKRPAAGHPPCSPSPSLTPLTGTLGRLTLGGAESTEGLGQLQEEGDEGDHPLKFTELCSHWAAYGNCPHGLHCRMVHGEECETCHKRLIHPFNPDLASEHAIECIARHEKLEAHLRSAAVECGICYERVLSAPNPSDRRFGLMSCDHAFCLTCIRTWRASNAADTEAAIRTCPICRVTTHFVTPSATWPESPAAKEAIVSAYRAKLAAIDCVHFRRGEGTCPFGTSCFYRHMRKDGQLESRDPGLRITRGEAGAVHVLGAVRLADFLETLAARRVL
ncbi:hypothetical protein V8C86DRAFT_3024807 [Haematococcus lacustris]